LDASALGYET